MFDHGVGIRNPLFFIGAVEANGEARLEGRVKVRAFGIHGTQQQVPTDMLPWAIVAQGGYDPNVVPKINSWVYGMFLDGRDAQQPMVLGLIPTQYQTEINPEANGWGVIPDRGGDVDAAGSTPEDYGRPQSSPLARGEEAEDTHQLSQEMGRTLNIPIAGPSGDTWDEPGSAYNAQYPQNRVISTRNHSIELDDTEGSERIMIHHKSGSFIQIDSRGTTVEKTTSDKYEVMDRKQHLVVGGMSTVTIMGNSYVKVLGDKIEEITGDLQTLVHGEYHLSVGGQATINASEQVQVRGADVKVEANVGTMSIKAGKELNIRAGGDNYGAISFKAEKVMIQAVDKLHLKGGTQVNVQSLGEMNFYSSGAITQLSAMWSAHARESVLIGADDTVDITGTTGVALGGGEKVDINADTVDISTLVNLAPPTPARVPVFAEGDITSKFEVAPGGKAYEPASPYPENATESATVEAPEPVEKSTSTAPVNQGSRGSSGYSSVDHSGEGGSNSGNGRYDGSSTIGDITAATQNSVTPLLDFIGNKESEGYDDISDLISESRYPSKPVTQMTIQEILDWQESIDRFQLSEAVGRYQVVEDTLRGFDNDKTAGPGNPLYTRAGLSTSSLYSPENQDKIAIVLIEGRGLTKFLEGRITREEFGDNLAGEWASLPLITGPNRGRSRYEGDAAGNRSLTSIDEVLAVIDQVKINYNGQDDTTQRPDDGSTDPVTDETANDETNEEEDDGVSDFDRAEYADLYGSKMEDDSNTYLAVAQGDFKEGDRVSYQGAEMSVQEYEPGRYRMNVVTRNEDLASQGIYSGDVVVS